ncbi:Protein kinase domain [Macleaya cordata]|uniref:Protein kinase domain n=1 Tax=Macleaya cordata TaxID=56857 RepID=A0A200Q605_MACCD|nr:Protein kinase domain [Macleaya cordata]
MTIRYYSRISPASTPQVIRSKSGFSQKHLLGAFVIGAGVVLVAVTLYFCVKRCYFEALRQWWWTRREELEKATQNFNQECLIGSGAFGNVYKGTFDEDRTFAIKKAHSDSFQSVQEFRNEVELISKVKHRNLVGLVGYCHEAGAKGAKALVYEYVPNGSLLEYIVGWRGKTLTWRQRVNIAIGAAKGIAFLHEGVKPSIIHRDIKPSNILIGSSFEAKVSDFGLVKSGPVGDQSHVSSQIKGTPGYLDPAYCSSFHLSPFSDVYSFGVILLQLVAARPAVDITQNNLPYHIIEWARSSLERGNVEEIIDVNLLTEPCNMEMMLKMGQLGLRCVVKAPKDRPTMTQVWQELEEALHSGPDHNYLVHKQPSRGSLRSMQEGLRRSLTDQYQQMDNNSQSFVSIDGLRFQRFRVEMDSLSSFKSISLRCLELNNNSISIDVDDDHNNYDLRGTSEEETSNSSSTDDEASLTRD